MKNSVLNPVEAAAGSAAGSNSQEAGSVEVEELLVEEVSIDGMCGVY
jgi:mycofactocin precursor